MQIKNGTTKQRAGGAESRGVEGIHKRSVERRVLARGWLPTMVAAVCGIVCLGVSFCAGVFTVWRYLARVPGLIPEDILQSDSWSSFASLCTPSLVVELMLSEAFPRSFVALGFSVLAVAIAYSLPPLHLSANALGELAVSYGMPQEHEAHLPCVVTLAYSQARSINICYPCGRVADTRRTHRRAVPAYHYSLFPGQHCSNDGDEHSRPSGRYEGREDHVGCSAGRGARRAIS